MTEQAGRGERPLRSVFRFFHMDNSLLDFAFYELVQMQTGVSLYTTFATSHEIIIANANLHKNNISSKFIRKESAKKGLRYA